MTAPHPVFLADDHPLIQDVIRDLLGREPDLQLVGSAANGDDACRDVIWLKPDLLILDLSMPGLPATEVIAAVRRQSPNTRILVMSAFAEPAVIRLLRDMGIEGYILKDEAPEMLVAATRTILDGATWFSRPIFETFLSLGHERTVDNPWATLTERERIILRFLGEGMSNRQIGNALQLAEQTIRNHVHRIYRKLGLESRAQAVIWLQSHADDP